MNAPPYAPPPPHAPPKRGFPTWLIVLLCTFGGLVILGPILLVLAIYGVRKYIANAKTAEARVVVATLAKDAVATWDDARGFCPSASRSIPPSASTVRGRKYLSAPSEWTADATKGAGFACLGFSMTQPQYYAYSYDAAPRERFEAKGRGDLDGDGTTSTFVMGGTVVDGTPTPWPAINEVDPEE